MDFRPIPFIALAIGIALFFTWWMRRREAARRERLKGVGRKLGLDHRDEDESVPGPELGALPEFNRGRGRRATSILSGELEGRPALVFDWAYTTSSGNNQKRHRRTMVAFHRPNAPFPEFRLSPESVFHKIGDALGRQDFDFENDDEFSGAYFLQGSDESAVRACFGRAVRRGFTRHPGWYVQADGAWITFWRMRRPAPDDLRAYVLEAAKLVSRFETE